MTLKKRSKKFPTDQIKVGHRDEIGHHRTLKHQKWAIEQQLADEDIKEIKKNNGRQP